MGFFSSDCESCGHPLLCRAATSGINEWMTAAVAITPNGSIIKGEYDGYGGIGATEHAIERATVWHQACWTRAGSPTDHRGESRPSADQGWFFGDHEHQMAEPR